MSQFNLFAEPTWRVSQLGEEIKLFLNEAFPRVWVVGEVQRRRSSPRGHVYFELVEKGQGDQILGRIDAVLWRSAAQRVGRELAEAGLELAAGAEIRCRGRVDFWPPSGRIQFSVDAIDPVFSLGQLERRRRQTLQELARAGLLERNGSLPLPVVPLRIGLVTSEGSAAYHDFVKSLEASPYRFEVRLEHAAVQGPTAEREVSSALERLASSAVEVSVVVRGGGSRSDLAAFDSRRIAEAIATHPVPVLCGLGHEIDRSVADQVAHTAVKTPTGAAEFLIRRAELADEALRDIERRLVRRAHQALTVSQRRVERGAHRLVAAAQRLRRRADRLAEVGRLLGRLANQRIVGEQRRWRDLRAQLVREAPRRTHQAHEQGDRLLRGIAKHTRWQLQQADREVEAVARLCRQLGPERTLARGFSITRTEAGAVLYDAGDVSPGDRVDTQLASGSLQSRVESRGSNTENGAAE